mmetsp:Transcript_143849/g.460483  ORF Transcript_143849/g.460483 Transcript_143849/m.460483 type:complete len:290 (+) Transcript_143849:107-976(+)
MQSLLAFVSSRPRTSGLYGCFFIGCLFVYRSLQAKQTGTYDFVLTLSAGLQALAFALLVCDTRSQVAEGLSEKTLWAFFIAHVTRLSTTFWGEGYVPEDNTGDVYLYQMLEVTGVVLLAYKILTLSTLRSMVDVGQGLERWNVLIGMVVAAVVLGWLTKTTGHNDYFADLSWMTSVWLEAFALVPQVQLLASSGGQLDESAVHFACVTLASSLAFGAFWWKSAVERYQEFMRDGYHGFLFGIVTAAAIRVFLCGVYVYLFVKSSKSLGLPGAGKKGEYELCAQEIEDEL